MARSGSAPRIAGVLVLALMVGFTSAQTAALSYTQGCASGTTAYGSTLENTAYAVARSDFSCSGAGYAGYGKCCNGAWPGTAPAWQGGSCRASTLPAVPMITQNRAVGTPLMCMDTSSASLGATVMVTPCGTSSHPTPSATQLWSWINGYGSNLYQPYSNLCVQAVSVSIGSRLQLATCSSSNLVGDLTPSGSLAVSTYNLDATSVDVSLQPQATGSFAQQWVSTLSLIHISEPTRPY